MLRVLDGRGTLPIRAALLPGSVDLRAATGHPPGQMTVHGFRAMARKLLDAVLGFRPDFIEYQLAHAVRGPNGRAVAPRLGVEAWATNTIKRTEPSTGSSPPTMHGSS